MNTDKAIENIIFSCVSGSRLYGTNTENSDYDYRSVCIPPLEFLLDPFNRFEQKDSGFEEKDKTIYALDKFVKLCADANPNIIELLFIPDKSVISKSHYWEYLLDNKSFFLSKKVKYTFSGYAMSQLNAIKTHRKWFIDPPKNKPTRKEFGLTDSPLVSGDGLNAIANIKFDCLKPEVADEIRRELEYRKAKQSWDNYISWKTNRNSERMALEEKYKFDTKHASHLVRLMMEGKELLLSGKITFPLCHADYILEIKNGKYSYEEIIEISERLDKEFDLWYDESTLPNSPNKKGLSNLYFDIVKSTWQ